MSVCEGSTLNQNINRRFMNDETVKWDSKIDLSYHKGMQMVFLKRVTKEKSHIEVLEEL